MLTWSEEVNTEVTSLICLWLHHILDGTDVEWNMHAMNREDDGLTIHIHIDLIGLELTGVFSCRPII